MDIRKLIRESCLVLKGWDGMDVMAKIEEDPKNIRLLIKYEDHGDDFLIVGTYDGGLYEYGCYANRDIDLCDIRQPELYKIPYGDASMMNEAFWQMERYFCAKEYGLHTVYDKLYNSKRYAQIVYNDALDTMYKLYNACCRVYDYDYMKKSLEKWLKLNGIDTEENIEKLRNAKFNNKIGWNKTIGIAGKKDMSHCQYVIADNVEFIYENGNMVNKKKRMKFEYRDEWGEDRYRIFINGNR